MEFNQVETGDSKEVVQDLKEIFKKKEAEISSLKKRTEEVRSNVHSIQQQILQQRKQTEIYRSDLAMLQARVSGHQVTRDSNRREADALTLQIEKLQSELYHLEEVFKNMTDKQIQHDKNFITSHTHMTVEQLRERSKVLKTLGMDI